VAVVGGDAAEAARLFEAHADRARDLVVAYLGQRAAAEGEAGPGNGGAWITDPLA
jgi:hypothetical protein